MKPAGHADYLLVTGCYWAFTLSDGALRMLVLLHLHELGQTPLALALVLLPYEVAGLFTNLLGGWLGARFGLKVTLLLGLLLQVIACGMLAVEAALLTVPWVMGTQVLSGIAKDLAKTGAKSFVRQLAPDASHAGLFRLVARLTGSKNAMKGLGFFVGGALLATTGFRLHHRQARADRPIGRAWIGLPSRNRSSSSATAWALAYRRGIDFSRHFRQIVSRSSGTAGLSCRGATGSRSSTCRSVSNGLSA